MEERAQTPGARSPEIVGDALAFLNKRTKRQQMFNSVKTFKSETVQLVTEQREAGTPDKLIAEALTEQVKEVAGPVRKIDFNSSLTPSPSRGELPPLPDYTGGGDAISIALKFLNARSKAKGEGKEMEKVASVKTLIGQPLGKAKETGVPDFLLEDALAETLAETGLGEPVAPESPA